MAGEKRFRNYYHIEKPGKEYLDYGKEQIKFVFSGVQMLMGLQEDSDGKEDRTE